MGSLSANEYRSPGIVRGYFRKLGGVHLHVDGGDNQQFILTLLKEFEANFPGKLTAISESAAGPQRERLPRVYASHTPGADEEEQFEYFPSVNT